MFDELGGTDAVLGGAVEADTVVFTFTLAAIKSDKFEQTIDFGSISGFGFGFISSSVRARSVNAFSMESPFSIVGLAASTAEPSERLNKRRIY